jgi:hypothetical protein
MDVQQAQAELENVKKEMAAIKQKLKAINVLLVKPLDEWSELELRVYGNHDQLRLKEHDLWQQEDTLWQTRLILSEYLRRPAPPVVTGTFADYPDAALSSYRQTAHTLKDNQCVREVCDVLLQITSGDFPAAGFADSPFVFLSGSSGTGKTQMAFNIEAHMSPHRQVHYVMFHSPRSNAQKIYLNFQCVSSVFSACCEKDRSMGSSEDSNLFPCSLYVYGFIYLMISDGTPPGRVEIGPKAGKDVRDLLIQKNLDKCRPVFMLDECIVSCDDHMEKLQFVRKCFRSLGLGLVTMGTDNTAIQWPSDNRESSQCEDPKPWCFVFGRLPAVDLSVTELPLDAPEWLKALLQNSRPLLAEFVSDRIKKSSCDFDTLLKDVFIRLAQCKGIFRGTNGRLGQLRLFHNARFPLTDWNSQSTPLTHSHLAQLEGQENVILMNNGRIHGKSVCDIWKPCSIFPKVQDDVLVYLLLMGGKDFCAFYFGCNKLTPYAYFFMKVKDNPDYRSHILGPSNAVGQNNDGMFLESLLCSTICAASHSNGLQGIGLKEFLMNLVFQLQLEKVECGQVSIAGLEQLDGINMTVPFLSPPNQEWPDFVTIPGANLGFLSRTRNSDKIDVWAPCGLAGEAKDYGSRINLVTMKQILNRVPEQAMLQIVFTRKLQKSYFNPRVKSFQKLFKSSHLLNKSFYKINASVPVTSLEPIQGLPSGTSSTGGAVIFFEIDESFSL